MRHTPLLRLLAVMLMLTAVRSFATDPSYFKATNERAQKIVAKLGIGDDVKAAAARDLIAQFYRDLNAIQAERDATIAAAKNDASLAKADRDAKINDARAAADAQRNALHDDFIESLKADLTPNQIEGVKDGLTYGVAPLTFRVYQQMLPELTAEQKNQIHAWLLEAREHAIAGFTSEEKHAWFGKYKGRINNYLSKAGYNMKETEARLARHDSRDK